MAPQPTLPSGHRGALRRTSGLAAHVLACGADTASSGAPVPTRCASRAVSSAAVPRGFKVGLGEDDEQLSEHIRWIEQKHSLGQDVLLLGPPGALRRHIALRYCELNGCEAEVLTITRDTTEADLKQRRELRRTSTGTRTVYADGSPVRCAMLGRVLILDGLEKAERNVMPTLNNLLENREMALDDGHFLLPANRFDELGQQTNQKWETTKTGGTVRGHLLRVHEDFRVIALALPCPPFFGSPLDPPLRSRFQARLVNPPVLLEPAHLGDGLENVPEALLRRLSAMQRALNESALGGQSACPELPDSLPPGVRPPILAHDAILRVLRVTAVTSSLPDGMQAPVSEAVLRAYPLELLTLAAGTNSTGITMQEAIAALLRRFELVTDADGHHQPLRLAAGEEKIADGVVALSFQGMSTPIVLQSPALPAPRSEEFVLLPTLEQLMAAIVQDFAVGHDCLLVGPSGCGKSALARKLAGKLGYGAPGGIGLEYFFLYEEMSSRDLLQRRATDIEGQTSWTDSPLVRAARRGALCILDGIHRLRGDVLCAIAPLLQDRQALLAAADDQHGADSELMLRADRFKELQQSLQDNGNYDAAAHCRVAQIHPAFRVLALAEPPSTRAPWLNEELSTYFSHHVYPKVSEEQTAQILTTLCPKLPSESIYRLLRSHKLSGSSPVAVSAPLRVLIRVARRASEAENVISADRELLSGILQQALFPFMPKGERDELIERLCSQFAASDVKVAAGKAHRSFNVHGSTKKKHATQEPEAQISKIDVQGDTVQLGTLRLPRGKPLRPELVPQVDFVQIGRHSELLEQLGSAMFVRGEQYLLLLGPQGVGKNRVVDHMLQTLNLEREYMQLHRDTTVAQLTVTPAIVDGCLQYEDSPLIRAAQHGRVLVLDEADKAPLEVVVVLKSLVEDGQLALPDGRRLARFAEASAGADDSVPIVHIHPDFRMVVLANRPGFPFLGNDLIREADVFSIFCLDNPDIESELQLVRSVGRTVPEGILRTLVGIFADLRLAVEEGRLQYPYSMRELLAVVRHIDRFPDESLESALASILAFDRFDPTVREVLRPIFEKHGVPTTEALGNPTGEEGVPEVREPWLRALSILRSVHLADTTILGQPKHAGTWRIAPGTDAPVVMHTVEVRPSIFDPPRKVSLAKLEFDRIKTGFSESVARAQLPFARQAGPVIDAVASLGSQVDGAGTERALHVLSSRPLVLWTVEDPFAVGPQAGQCTALPIGAASDWGFHNLRAEANTAAKPTTINISGRDIQLGTPQLLAVPGASAVLLHSPLDILAPQLLLEGLHREDIHAEVLLAAPLTTARAGKVRPRTEDSFVAVPCSACEAAIGTSEDDESLVFTPGNSAVFFQPSGRCLVQMDVVHRMAREVRLDGILGEIGRPSGILSRLHRMSEPTFSITATATERGTEVLIGTSPTSGSPGPRFLAVLLPQSQEPVRPPIMRWVLSEGISQVQRLPTGLEPAVAGAGLVTLPLGPEKGATFAATSHSEGLAHLMEGGRDDEGRSRVLALHEVSARPQGVQAKQALAALQQGKVATVSGGLLPTIAELARADDSTLDRLLNPPPPTLPGERNQWLAAEASVPGDLLIRSLRQPQSQEDWVEAVHASSRTARRLPARIVEEAEDGTDTSGGGAARLIAWAEHGERLASAAPDTCVVFRNGTVQWLELHPESLERSLREYLAMRGLRLGVSRASGEGRRGGGKAARGARSARSQRTRRRPRRQPDDGDQEEEEEEEEEQDIDVIIQEEDKDDHKQDPEDDDDADDDDDILDGEELDGVDGDEAEEIDDGEDGDEGTDDMDNSRSRGSRRSRNQVPGPERVREEVLRSAREQRRRMVEAQRREEKRRETSRDASGKPKHGDEDDQEHVGGNRWAGGSGGADTAGLGGKGGPYRLEKKGQNVHQISDEAKKNISDDAREAARRMGEEAREKRLAEIEMGGGDYDLYMTILGEVQGEIDQLRRVLSAATARQRERVWNIGLEGELDEKRLVDAIAGEAAVFKRRAEREARPGEVLMQPKRVLFLFDASSSMYRFNGMDGRLRKSAEAAVMLMEALRGFEQKYDYAIHIHDGDHVMTELVPFGRPPTNEKDRLRVVAKLLTASQYCSSGDNTLPAIERACERVEATGPADDYFVFAFSDANLTRYGITAKAIGDVFGRHRSVNAVVFFIATFEDEALTLAKQMPDRMKVCLDLKKLPAEIRQQFVSSVARGARPSL